MKRKLRETLRRILSIILMIVMLPLSSLQPAFTAIVHAEGTDDYVSEAPLLTENGEEDEDDALKTPENTENKGSIGGGNVINNDDNTNTNNVNNATDVAEAEEDENSEGTEDEITLPAAGNENPAEGEGIVQPQNRGVPEETTEENSETGGLRSAPAESVEIVNLELEAVINECGNAVLDWKKIANEDIEYFVYRNDELIDSFSLDNEEGESVSYIDTKTAGGTEYTYKVEGKAADVIYGESDEFVVKTPDVLELNSDYTLTSNMTVFEIKQHAGQLNLNGFELTVCKNYVTDGYNSRLYLNGGSFICNGDLYINYYYSYITMTNAQDYLYVKGNVNFNNNDYNDLSNGIFEVAGNVNANYFRTKSFNKVILSGSELQSIDISNDSYIQYLIDNNVSEEGINFVKPTQIFAFEFDDEAKVSICGKEVDKGFTLFEDTTIDGDFSIGFGVLDLNGYKLTINGNFTQMGGDVVIGDGELIVKGNYSIENEVVNDNEEIQKLVSAGRLIMNNDSGKVTVEGDFTTRSIVNHDGLLTNGTLEIKGDFYQISGSTANFRASGDHNVLLSGNGKQTVKFTNSWSDQSYFNNLEITNNSEEGVVFDTTSSYPLVRGLVTDHGNKVTGAISIIESTSFDNNHYCSDVVVVERVTISKELETEGNFSTGEQYDMAISGKLTVGGDLSLQTYYAYLYSDIHVKGNLYIGGRSGSHMNLYLYNGSVEVDGDLKIDRRESWAQTRINNGNSDKDIPVTVKKNLYIGENCYYAVPKGVLTLGGNLSGNGYLQLSGTHKTILNGTDLQ
ncbi:hypothetical protein SAMN04487760_109122, partial [Lachnospiraceae bacterium G41]